MCLAPGMKDRFSWNADQSTLDALQNGSLGVVELLHCTPGHQYQVPSANVAETAWLFMTASEVTEHRCHDPFGLHLWINFSLILLIGVMA